MAATWQPAAVLATVGAAELVGSVRQDVREEVAQFVNAYKLGNSRS
jgi:hypothetical protein